MSELFQEKPDGNLKDPNSGNLSPDAASVKKGGSDNNAYAGVPQADDPKVLKPLGQQLLKPDTRSMMAAYCDGVWEAAKEDREANGIDEELLACLRQFEGEYSAVELADIDAAGFPHVYFPLSEHKVHTAEAWIDEFFSNGEMLVNLKPTPVAELENDIVKVTQAVALRDIAQISRQNGMPVPPQMATEYAKSVRPVIEAQMEQECQERAYRMERQIHDDMVQGDWTGKIQKLIGLTCIYGTAAFRSPVISIERNPVWERGKIVSKKTVVRTFEAISPFDLFPSAGMEDTHDGDFCVRVRYRPGQLSRMLGTPCWCDSAVKEVLEHYGATGFKLDVSSDSEREELEQQESSQDKPGTIEGFEFFGSVSGKMLRSIGVQKDAEGEEIKDTDYDWYGVDAISLAHTIVYCRVIHDFEDCPVDTVKFYNRPGSFWGRGPLQLIAALQKICNSAGRAIVMNMGFSALPQSIVDVTMLDPRDDGQMRPGKAWMVRQNGANPNGKPITFFTVESNAKEMTECFEFFQRLADEVTGIPAYANGTDAAVGAARTATGLNMLFGAANRGIKKVISNFDELVKKAVRRLYNWHMVYNPSIELKGDAKIEVTGLKYFSTKTQRVNEIMNLLARLGQDERLRTYQGDEQIVKLLREVAVCMDLSPDALAPTMEQLKKKRQEDQQKLAAAQQQQLAAAQQAQQLKFAEIEKQAQADIAVNDAKEKAKQQGAVTVIPPQPGDTPTPKGRPKYAPRPKGEGGAE